VSDIQPVMNLEFLPNEVLIECFEYLNAFEIFYSFDGLNYRFTQLIQTIPLYLNFQHVRKSIFDQIYSLHLSDKGSCGQTEEFLSLFSVNEFSHLRSLTLDHLRDCHVDKLKTMLPLLSELHSFRIMQSECREFELLSVLPTTKLQILSIPEVSPFLIRDNQILSIKSLTVSNCSLVDLIEILTYMPMLKYLQIQTTSKYQKLKSVIKDVNNYHAVHLKQLIINQLQSEFTELELFIRKAPNLTNLTICSKDSQNIVDAGRWEYLIRSSLPNLNTFNFAFYLKLNSNFSRYALEYIRDKNTIDTKFKSFQTSFWREEHHWYTEYLLWKYSACLFTIPFIEKQFPPTFNIERYSDGLTNNSNAFDNVTDLTVDAHMIAVDDGYYFSNVTSLVIVDDSPSSYYPNTTSKRGYIQNLKTIVNLCSLKHVCLSSNSLMASSRVLLQLLKDAPQLSSMIIDPLILMMNCANI
jgi:hypothetical protein